ncbi:hypothetical protein PMAYCL1PPCAC_30473 [Pristionchus mayeri]|uniref:Uncharacterized protein n=1 Tax=Pristionchus mayeri TaxID=1317129 RepID=A0AAN5DDM7_9BILA|nr:hypothetical protein PMAYCL1PPCAC_30472 [Pristionchus mayeri]GMR60278.1 hypothetical protein PMAYCL1PPCAC_30473 [Pristionchus mayeri]
MTQQNGPRELPGVGCFSDLLANYRPLQLRSRTHTHPITHIGTSSLSQRAPYSPSHYSISHSQCSRCPPGLVTSNVNSSTPPGMDRLPFGTPPGLSRPITPSLPPLTEDDLVPSRQLKWSNADHNDFERVNPGFFSSHPSVAPPAHFSEWGGNGCANHRDSTFDTTINEFAMKMLLAQMCGVEQSAVGRMEHSYRNLPSMQHSPTSSYDSSQRTRWEHSPPYSHETNGRNSQGFADDIWSNDWLSQDRTGYEFGRRLPQ